jgi:hypothetical protein
MEIDWATIVGKVPEIAIVLAIIWFTLKMIELKNASLSSIVNENMTSVTKITSEFSASIEKIMAREQEQSVATMAEWRVFLQTQREEDRNSMNHLTREVNELAAVIYETHPRATIKERNPKTRPLS